MPDVTLSAGAEFPEGTRVTAYARTGDLWPGDPAGLGSVKTATSDGQTVVFKGLDAGAYWAVGENGHKAFSSKDVPARKVPVKAAVGVDRQKTPVVPERRVITGPRGSLVYSHVPGDGDQVVESKTDVVEPQPHMNQATVPATTPQRSSTVLGQATPKDPGEPQPKPRQEDVKKGVRQRSSTETGEATVIVDDAGPDRQDEVSGRTRQRSDTEVGEATPKGTAEPRGTSSNPDSREQAAGVRPTDTKARKSKGAVAKKPAVRKVKK